MAKHITVPQFDKLWKRAKALFVSKEEGKGLSTNDFDNDAKTKLAGIAEGAEKNVISAVKVNGTAVTVGEDGTVDIPVESITVEDATDEEIEAVLNGTYEESGAEG